MRSILLVLLSSLFLIPVPAGEALPTTVTIEGESGTPVNQECAIDGEPMQVHPGHMFFPELGCTASYAVQAPTGVAVESVRVRVGGMDNVCGRLLFSGAVAGMSEDFCLDAGAYHDVPVAAAGSTGGLFLVTWLPAGPLWVNLDLDRMTVVALA